MWSKLTALNTFFVCHFHCRFSLPCSLISSLTIFYRVYIFKIETLFPNYTYGYFPITVCVFFILYNLIACINFILMIGIKMPISNSRIFSISLNITGMSFLHSGECITQELQIIMLCLSTRPELFYNNKLIGHGHFNGRNLPYIVVFFANFS